MSEKKKRGAAPGENRFRKNQEKQVRSTIEEIKVVLELLRTRRVTFRNITHLASYVADVITEKRGANLRKMALSTLLRTTVYRVKLDGYLALTGSKFHDDKFVKLISDLELKELNELRIENKRLSQYIEKNLSSVPELPPVMPQSDSMQVVDQLCRAISLLLEASSGQFLIDQKSGEIVNGWAKSKKNRIIVPGGISKPYLEWHKSFPPLGNKEDAS